MHLLVAAAALVGLASATLAPVTGQTCDDLSCASREELLETIRQFQEERQKYHTSHLAVFSSPRQAPNNKNIFIQDVANDDAAPTAPTCNICGSEPCLNGGNCLADPNNPWEKYYCECPDNYSGDHCETKITCQPDTCGANAQCFVSNHQTNCICDIGYSSPDPRNGCSNKVVKSCGSGDPHFLTFDGLHYDYMGTCPYVFSEPRQNLTGGYDNFKVVARNTLTYPGSHVSYVTEIEVTMYNQKVHVDTPTRNVYFNGFRINVPYYYPSASQPNISVTYSSNTFYISNDQFVVVSLDTGGYLCLQIPDVPELRGQDTLAGLAGNLDGNPLNDIIYPNGTVFPVDSAYVPYTPQLNHANDAWITSDFLKLRVENDQCLTGETIGNNSNCDPAPAVAACFPILQAMNQDGVFAACYPMGNQTIQSFYDNCVFDVCHGSQKCSIIPNFARACMQAVPNHDLGPWRNSPTVDCPMTCPATSQYSSCMSSCPWTCSEHSPPDFCNKPCSEGCECLPGYVLDTTQLGSTTCIPINQCGCTDKQGNIHPADEGWLTDNCQTADICKNGTLVETPNACGDWAECGKDSDDSMACVCDKGFEGDGYNCTDIDECLDPNSCSAGKGQGICTNLPGTYNCTCNQFYTGNDCENYQPRRHCADLFIYWGIRASGVYTINPAFEVNGNPALTGIDVYCNMELLGGGWTLLSHDTADLMANKTFAEYERGFGDVKSQKAWLGLEFTSKMTAEMPTSLMLWLYRCGTSKRGPIETDCTYPIFSVGDSASTYAVTIPEECSGTEDQYDIDGDGWVRWNTNEVGPAFKAYDTDKDALDCSATFQNTGFWFEGVEDRCGAANLNGVRYSCDNPPTDTGSSYLHWNGNKIGDAAMYLRPKDFPYYDSHNYESSTSMSV